MALWYIAKIEIIDPKNYSHARIWYRIYDDVSNTIVNMFAEIDEIAVMIKRCNKTPNYGNICINSKGLAYLGGIRDDTTLDEADIICIQSFVINKAYTSGYNWEDCLRFCTEYAKSKGMLKSKVNIADGLQLNTRGKTVKTAIGKTERDLIYVTPNGDRKKLELIVLKSLGAKNLYVNNAEDNGNRYWNKTDTNITDIQKEFIDMSHLATKDNNKNRGIINNTNIVCGRGWVLTRNGCITTTEKDLTNVSVLIPKAEKVKILDRSLGIEELIVRTGPKEIGNRGLSCYKLKRVVLPDTLEVLGDSALEKTRITSIDLLRCKNLRYIGERCFEYTWLEEVILPDSVEYIGNWAFGSTKIKYFIYPRYMEEINLNCLYLCEELQTLVLPDIKIKKILYDGTKYSEPLLIALKEIWTPECNVGAAKKIAMMIREQRITEKEEAKRMGLKNINPMWDKEVEVIKVKRKTK